MHPNPAFRQQPAQTNLGFARSRAFGVLTANGDDGPLAAHVPFLLAADGSHADLHLMRSNPIAQALVSPLPALLAVSGPDGYVSPDWYGDAAQVPTWNYVAVHLRGRLERLPDQTLFDLLTGQSAAFETRLAPKEPWRMEKTPPETLTRLMRMVVPVRLHVENVDGTWKLAQNKPEGARLAAADEIDGGFGQELAQLARLMRDPAHEA